jgi:hypothetical protein
MKGRVKRGGYRKRSFDTTPIIYGVMKVNGIDYDITYYCRYGDNLIVMSSPELGGLGPVYGRELEEAEAQLKDLIVERREHGKGWTEAPWFWSTRNRRWEKRHGYGDNNLLTGRKRNGKKEHAEADLQQPTGDTTEEGGEPPPDP